jgi:LAO/AO transport system kinase
LRLLRPISALWTPVVMPVSSLTGDGIDRAWTEIQRHQNLLTDSGERQARRAAQAQAALWADLGEGLIAALQRRPDIARRIPAIETDVRDGTMTPMAGARQLLALFLGPSG